MLTIGIIDITTIGSTLCQRRISELGGVNGDHPEFAVHSLPYIKYREAFANYDWKNIAMLVKDSIEKLNKVGVDFIIIPSNTPHYAYEEFSKNSPVPIVNLIDIIAAECHRLKLKKVAILGTKVTMQNGLYVSKLSQYAITPVIPSPHLCDEIQQYIVEDLIPGKVNLKRRENILQQINQLDCDSFILGCTELPEVYSSADLLGKPTIDTTRLLAEKAFEIAKSNNIDILKNTQNH